MHREGGELMRFDRVITNPPFSQNYTRDGMDFPERFHFGFTPENGKKADLMFAQHMLAVLRPSGMVATVMPHGVLFRGSAEKEIREGLVADDLIEAVIGLGPNLFYGTGIPACILVLRAKGAKPEVRKGKLIFINADHEFEAGRAQNYLRPEHIEKIVSTFEAFRDVPGYARVVTSGELSEAGYNLNIRHYADNSSGAEPEDVRAHLNGGIPASEVAASSDLLTAHGLGPAQFLINRDEQYFDFVPDLTERAEIRSWVERDEGVKARDLELIAEFESWWSRSQHLILGLPVGGDLMKIRAELLDTFREALVPVGLLDRFKVSGVIARWWDRVQFDLKTIKAQGVAGLIDGWVTTITTALEDEKSKANPLDHKLVKRLLPAFLSEIMTAEARVADLDAAIKATQPSDDEADDVDDTDDALSDVELKELKKRLTAEKKQLKALKTSFVERLREAEAALSDEQAQELVIDILRAELLQELDDYAAAHRAEVTHVIEKWWDKYRVMLRATEASRDAAKGRLDTYLTELGYG